MIAGRLRRVTAQRVGWLERVKRMRGPLVAVASVGAVLSGLVGYYTTYRAVTETKTVSALPTIESDPSIAVLPLVNLGGDKEQEFFSDGLSEELLNLLAQVPRLRVIARTSSFSFKGKDLPAETIARQLNVAALLEGSVRRSGDSIRVQLHLVRATDSSRMWSATYDRPVQGVFQLQDEIASAVVAQLKGTLLGAAPKARPMDPQAYELLLRGQELLRQGSVASSQRAVGLLEQGLARAPREPRLLLALGVAHQLQAETSDRPLAEGYGRARTLAQQALAADPDNADAHAMLGNIAGVFDRDLPGAASHLQRALAVAPGDTPVLARAARLLLLLAREDAAGAAFHHLAQRDPANPRWHRLVGDWHASARRWDEAIASYAKVLELSPSFAGGHADIARVHLWRGDPQAALAELQREPWDFARLIGLARVHHALGQRPESDAALAALVARYEESGPSNIAQVHAFRGEPDQSFAWLEKAVRSNDTGLSRLPVSRDFQSLHGDPRWGALLRRLGKSPEQLAAVRFHVELPK
ncbi:MAG: tetratricopeptide repeat protein [Burkholderiales bacterium]|nr:tetratricopeptide repeat protein [Burkholderiales bacterium]